MIFQKQFHRLIQNNSWIQPYRKDCPVEYLTFHTVTVNENNEIILVGDPVYNEIEVFVFINCNPIIAFGGHSYYKHRFGA